MEFSRPERFTTPSEEDDEEKYGLTLEEKYGLSLEYSAHKSKHIGEQDEQIGIDHLTGLKNRKFFEHELEQALKNIRRGAEEHHMRLKEVSLISIDLDFFKQVNDTFGHQAGDEVLRKVSMLLKASVRETDVAARLGGEELMLLLRGATVDTAARHAEELRAEIEQLTFDAYPNLKVTASFGVVSSEGSDNKAETLMKNADVELYRAKHSGRNRVEVQGMILNIT
ncbi:MAG: GGDEF domain-containing protein [bacterium]|nr:GGDEF domain-containing protein [bacterium]